MFPVRLAQMELRDQKVINHIGLYRLTLRAVVTEQGFDGSETACGNVIQRLLDDGRIQSIEGLPNGFHYYQLTKKEAIAQGLPENRAQPLGPRALNEALAIVWFCCMGRRTRHRLESRQIQALLGQSFQTPHCVEKGAGKEMNRVYRIFAPGPATKPAYVVNQVAKLIDEVMSLSPAPKARYGPADMMRERTYAVAVLADTESRREKLHEMIKARELMELAHVIVELAPSPETLSEAINRSRKDREYTDRLSNAGGKELSDEHRSKGSKSSPPSLRKRKAAAGR